MASRPELEHSRGHLGDRSRVLARVALLLVIVLSLALLAMRLVLAAHAGFPRLGIGSQTPEAFLADGAADIGQFLNPLARSSQWAGAPSDGQLAIALAVSGAVLAAFVVVLAVVAGLRAHRRRAWLRPTRPLPGGGLARWSLSLMVASGASAYFGLALVAEEVMPSALQAPDDLATSNAFAAASATVGILALLALLGSVRRLRLSWLARRPGPVDVLPIGSSGTNQNKNLPPEELTLLIRRELAHVNLYATSLVPGADNPQDFLGLVQSRADSSGMIARVSRLLSVAWPNHAYRVHCQTLKPRATSAQSARHRAFGVSVQVQLVPNWLSTPSVHWAPTREDAARAAAVAVAQEILPWTRAGRRLPWADWVDEAMPAGLLEAYERGKKLVASRRYDEAIGAFREGLRLDPKNLELRLEMAHVYQKLALWMDALELYTHVEELAHRRLDDLPRVPIRRKPLSEWRAARTARLVAQYRRTITMSWADRLADQWMRGLPFADEEGQSFTTRRDAEKQEARHRLVNSLGIEVLGSRLSDDRSRGPGNRALGEWFAGLFVARPRAYPAPSAHAATQPSLQRREQQVRQDKLQTALIRLTFHYLAAQGSEQLLRCAPDRRVRKAPVARVVTRESRRLVHLWAHYHWNEEQLRAADLADQGKEVDTSQTVLRQLLTASPLVGNAQPAGVQERVDALTNGIVRIMGRSGEPRQWLDHYNAACVLAAPMTRRRDGDSQTGESFLDLSDRQREVLERDAIEQLRNAMRRTPTGMLGNLAPWVCLEDPDLDQLREGGAFAIFSKRQFPGEQPGLRRPSDAHVFELAMRTVRTARYSADLLSQDWRELARNKPASVAEMKELLRREKRSWQLVELMARNHKHAPTRLELIDSMTGLTRARGLRTPNWAHPGYPTLIDPDDPPPVCRPLVDAADCRFDRILSHLQTASARRDRTDWLQFATDTLLEGWRFTDSEWREIALRQAAMWDELAGWLDGDGIRAHASVHDASASAQPPFAPDSANGADPHRLPSADDLRGQGEEGGQGEEVGGSRATSHPGLVPAQSSGGDDRAAARERDSRGSPSRP